MTLLGRQAFLCGVRPGTAAASPRVATGLLLAFIADRHAGHHCPALASRLRVLLFINVVRHLLSIELATSLRRSQRTELDLAVLPVCRRSQRCNGLHSSVRLR